MKIEKDFLCVFTLLCLSAALIQPSSAQSTPQLHSVGSPLASGIENDDADINFDSVSIPMRYAHGFKTHPSGRLPFPTDAEASKRYVQAQELRDKGVVYLYNRRYDKAIQRLKQSLALWPDSAPTYRWLAETYEAKGETQEAITNYRLLFYGWPGKYVPNPLNDTKPKSIPADKPSDYDQPNPEEVDPTLLMRFSLLLQQTNQYPEARSVYNRGIEALAQKFPGKEALAPLALAALATPSALEAATRTALAVDELSYQDKTEAIDNLKQALRLQPDFALADDYLKKNAE